jgi:hypothetical protein
MTRSTQSAQFDSTLLFGEDASMATGRPTRPSFWKRLLANVCCLKDSLITDKWVPLISFNVNSLFMDQLRKLQKKLLKNVICKMVDKEW